MIRTRAITDKLPHDDLVKQGIIPDIVSIISQYPQITTIKRYPPFVYKSQEYAMFGMIMDYVVRAGFRINLQQHVELGIDPVSSIISSLEDNDMIAAAQILNKYETSENINDIMTSSLKLSTILMGNTSLTDDILAKYVPTAVNIIKEIITKWNYYSEYIGANVKFNTEYSHGCFAGHPDIVTELSVLDIKNTTSFPKMAKESSLQILAYYAVMKQTIPNLKYVGFVLPMQRDIFICDVSSWDPSQYLQLLLHEADKLITQTKIPNEEMLLQILFQAFSMTPKTNIHIGVHISKGKNIAATLRNFASQYPELPCQMFLANPRSGKRDAKTYTQIEAASQIIKEHNLIYFTHAPYIINLCANLHDSNGNYWQQQIINEDLALTSAMGGKGVVVHTGCKKTLSEEDALVIMEHMVRSALPYATEECPLLLETPCGEGTEVVTKIEELGMFFFRFNEEERRKLGVCIDTCHVFSAAYDPLLYLQHWEKYCKIPIKLVHYNDSSTQCGSHVDRHAPAGTGYIGMEKMQAIAEWCCERSIPMVRE